MSILKITEDNFEEEVLKSTKPVIIDFYADWCMPCKMMSPIIEDIAEELGDSVKVGKINSDENISLAEKYEIMSIPTILIFKNGQIASSFLGVTEKNEIINAVKV